MSRPIHFLPVAATLVILACVWGFAPLPVVTKGMDSFHERSKSAIESLPLAVGTWEGEVQPLDARSKELLQPNAEKMIRFTDRRSGQQAYFSIVQTADGRLMAGHAPSNCYPNAGWTIDKVDRRTVAVAPGFELKPAVYHMNRKSPDGLQRWVVYDLFIFPDGRDGTELREIDRFSQDYRTLKYGIAHLQVVTSDPTLKDGDRDKIYQSLVGSERCLEMFRVLRTGIPK